MRLSITKMLAGTLGPRDGDTAGHGTAMPAWLARADQVNRVFCLTMGAALGIGYAVSGIMPKDAGIFWTAGHSAHYYGAAWAQTEGYIYPPVLAQLLGLLTWPVFIVPWMIALWWAYWIAARWFAAPIILVGLVSVFAQGLGQGGPLVQPLAVMVYGNPAAFVAAVTVVGLRRPALWGVVLLTKIGPGIGLVWFAVRREWRNLGIALGATAAVAGASLLMAPGAWGDFFRFALANYATPGPIPVVPVPLLVRLPMALVLVAWGAKTDRPWTVPIAAGWAALALYEWSFLITWTAALPMLIPRTQRASLAATTSAEATTTS